MIGNKRYLVPREENRRTILPEQEEEEVEKVEEKEEEICENCGVVSFGADGCGK